MNGIVKSVLFLVSLVVSSFSSASSDCDTADFVAGPTYVKADNCLSGFNNNADTQPNSILNALLGWAGTGWTEYSRYENGGTGFGPLQVTSTNQAYDFGWNVGTSSLAGNSVMFVVKQGNSDPNWMAYLFNNISDGFGYFNIDEELRGENDYSHLRLYTRETAVSVPEIDASFAFIALAFLAGFIAIRREHG